MRLLLAFLFVLIPIEYKYDKVFRFFSLSLIPEGVELPSWFDPKIYFYPSDLIAPLLFCLAIRQGAFWKDLLVQKRAFLLWSLLPFALLSLLFSPLANYPLVYIRLLQLLTPLFLYSVLANGLKEKENIFTLFFIAIAAMGLFESTVAICQYIYQSELGLRFLGEPRHLLNCIPTETGKRWLFDAASNATTLIRPTGTLPHPNVLGGFLFVSIMSLLALAEKRKTLLLFLFPLLGALLLSFSRSAIGATCLGVGLYAFRCPDWKKLAPYFLLPAILFSILFYEEIINRGGLFNYNETALLSDDVRRLNQEVAIQMIHDHPINGVGYQLFGFARENYARGVPVANVHNVFYLIGAELGLFALAAFLFFLLSHLKTAFLGNKALFSIVVGFLFISFFDYYPFFFQQGKLLFFSSLALFASSLHWEKEVRSSVSL